MNRREIASEADMFRYHGFGFAEAHRILVDGCQYPPSLEGFLYLLHGERDRSCVQIAPATMARRVVANCPMKKTA